MSTIEELQEQYALLDEARRLTLKKLNDLQREEQQQRRQRKQERLDHLRKTGAIRPEHLVLLKAMEFEYYKDGGDLVFIGVDGKRPFGNSDIYGDVAELLNLGDDWDVDYIDDLFEELPIVLNSILSRLDLVHDRHLTLKGE